MIAALGHSEDLDSNDAINEALDGCAARLDGKTPQAGLLYAGIDHDHQALLDGVEARYPGLQLIGCTTHGELSSHGFAEDSVVLMLLYSERVHFRVGVGEHARTDPEGAARRALTMALDGLDGPVRLVITLSEGLDLDTATVLRTLSAGLGPDVLLCGGKAADQFRIQQTYQFCNGAVHTGAVALLCVAGPLHASAGVASGWAPMGDDHRLTRVDGLVIREIDGESPRDFWMRYLGSTEIGGARGTFAVYPEGAAGLESIDFYLCAPSHFEDDGSMVTLNPAIEGARMRFTDARREEILSGTSASTAHARGTYPGGVPEAALVFSCAGRHALLGTQVGLELGRLQAEIGADVPVAGFYTYGEFCPLPGSSKPFEHGCTFVTVLIGEAA